MEHLLNDREVTGVADEIGAEFTLPVTSKGHVVAQDIMLDPVGVDDSVQALVRLASSRCLSELDIVDLGAPNDASCSATERALQALRLCTYFCATTYAPPANSESSSPMSAASYMARPVGFSVPST